VARRYGERGQGARRATRTNVACHSGRKANACCEWFSTHTRTRDDGVVMRPIEEAAAVFLANKRIAVTGVSRTPKGHGSNAVYKRLRDRGYDVFAVNPNADMVEGDKCFASLGEIPDGVEAVVIATRPDIAQATMSECHDLGITQTWMHRAFGAGRCAVTRRCTHAEMA
jgi:predicted CoA-binding protein